MTPNLLDELATPLAELKDALATMAKYAPAPGVLCAPTMEMGLGWKAKHLLPKVEAAHTALADMAKRMEAAERDARRYALIKKRFDDMTTSESERFLECLGIDGDVYQPLDAAIDATQEGEA